MANDRRRQLKLERKRKKRTIAQKRARMKAPPVGERSQRAIILHAAQFPFGPAYLSEGWDEPDALRLVTAVVTRKRPDGWLIPAIALVDRTCLGIKDGHVRKPTSSFGFGQFLSQMERAHDMEEHEPLLVQSIVFHAIDYANSLGFKPHADFPAALFGPRPAALLDTPLARPERPHFVAGPYDDAARIIAQLESAVGPGNYDCMLVAPLWDEDDLDDELIDEVAEIFYLEDGDEE